MWVLALAAVALSLVGCIKMKALVVVNPDGSGNIVVSSAMSPQVAGMMSGFASGLGGKDGAAAAVPKDPFFDEDELKKAASKFGEGVAYVKGRKTDDAGWQGSVAVYAFTDVNKVKLDLNEGKKAGPPGMDAGDKPAGDEKKKVVTFQFVGGDTKTLKILVPQEDKKSGESEAKAPKAPGADAMAQQMMAGMLPMLKGMEVSFAVQVKGEIVSNSAQNKGADGRVVLMEMNMDEMQTSPKFAEIIAKAQGGNKDMPADEMLGMPGFKFETNKVVEVKFK
jgi:hypothetical protein